MKNKQELKIGMIGYNMMGKAHSHAYRDAPFYFDKEVIPVLQSIAGRNEEKVKKAANQYGWNCYESDWKRLIDRQDIDVIDISTLNNTHAEIAIAAAEAGKHSICEKPLALTLAESRKML